MIISGCAHSLVVGRLWTFMKVPTPPKTFMKVGDLPESDLHEGLSRTEYQSNTFNIHCYLIAFPYRGLGTGNLH